MVSSPVTLMLIVTGAACHRGRTADLDRIVAGATIDDGMIIGPHMVIAIAGRHRCI